MPLNSIGQVAGAGSSGAVAREARVSDSVTLDSASTAVFAQRETVVRGNADDGPPQFVANYLSPFIRLDSSTRLAILQFRDSETGEVQQQYPSRRAVKEYAQNLPDNFDLPRAPKGGDDRALPSFGKPANEPTGEARIIGAGQGGGEAAPLPDQKPTTGSGSGAPSNPAIAAFGAALSGLTSGFSSRQVAVA